MIGLIFVFIDFFKLYGGIFLFDIKIMCCLKIFFYFLVLKFFLLMNKCVYFEIVCNFNCLCRKLNKFIYVNIVS